MEPIDLMRCVTGDFFRGDPHNEKWRGEAVTWWKAMPRAEYDALVAERDAAERQADALVGDRGELLARAEKAEAQRDAFISGREMQRERADAATARAERAEAEARTQSVLAAQAQTLARIGMDSEAERNAVLVVQLRAAKEKAERERDDAHRASITAAEDFANATGRVCQSNLELRALLARAKDHLVECICIETAEVIDTIDAILDTPTDDDGRGGGRGGGGE